MMLGVVPVSQAMHDMRGHAIGQFYVGVTYADGDEFTVALDLDAHVVGFK